MSKPIRQWTDEEIRECCRDLCHKAPNEQAATESIYKELGNVPAILFSKRDAQGQRMEMGMISNWKGDTVAF